jgi:hypothetical protein
MFFGIVNGGCGYVGVVVFGYVCVGYGGRGFFA